MAIFLDYTSKVVVQGMTGAEGRKHTQRMIMSGTRIVGGVTPGKGGQSVRFEEDPVPVFDSMHDAVNETGANVSVVFVPAPYAKAAVMEAIDAEVPLVVCITEGIPVRDTAEFFSAAQRSGKTRILGPNCPGIISPGRSNAGIIPANIAGRGRIGLVSKSGTLTYQMMYELREFGFSTAVGIGGDPIIGTTHIDCLREFEADPETQAIVMIGEIGGDAEAAAEFIAGTSRSRWSGMYRLTAPEGRTRPRRAIVPARPARRRRRRTPGRRRTRGEDTQRGRGTHGRHHAQPPED